MLDPRPTVDLLSETESGGESAASLGCEFGPVRSPAASLRMALRMVQLLPHVAYGLILTAVVLFDFTGKVKRERLAQHWSSHLLRILGVRVRVRGQAVEGASMMVANHISWLDISVLFACARTRFVSKSEVRKWPVAGWLAEGCGTFYIRRGRNDSRPLLNKLVPYLRNGGSVVVFPEGTTTGGDGVRLFHPRLFAAAIESGVWVQPVALRYGQGDGGITLAPFVGDDDLLSHLLRLLRNRVMDAEVIFCPPIDPAGRSRELLARMARASICRALGVSAEGDSGA